MKKGTANGPVARNARGLSIETPWPRSRKAAGWFALVVVMGFLLQISPRPAGWPLRYLFAEDGQVFLTGSLRDGWASLFDTYAGYLHVGPRSLSLFCSELGSPESYVACLGIATAGVKVAILAIVWPVLSAYARSWGWGLFAASSFVFIPVGHLEVLGNITNLRWFLVAGAFFALIGVFAKPGLALAAGVLVLVASLSDPLVLAWLPLALWRIVGQSGCKRIPGVAAIVGSAFHLVALEPTARGERGTAADLLANPVDTVAQLLVRGPVAAQNGMIWTQDLLRFTVVAAVLSLIVTGLVVVAAWQGRKRYPDSVRLAFLLVVVGELLLLVVLSFPASYIAFTEIWSPSQPSRYSAFAALFLTPAVILLMSVAWRAPAGWWQRPAAVLFCAVLVGAFFSDGRGDPRHSSGPTWDQTLSIGRAQCLSSTQSEVQVVNVPEYEGWQTTLTCQWLSQ